jgi:hypothetical protein
MKIVEQYKDNRQQVIRINSAKYLGDYVFRIFFSDGTEKLVDLKSFLQNSQHPSINKYLKEDLISKFQIVGGNLNWNDYDLIFPIWDLYTGTIKT